MDKPILTTDFTPCRTVFTNADGTNFVCYRLESHPGPCGGPLEPIEQVEHFFASGIAPDQLGDLAYYLHTLIRDGHDSAEMLMVAEAINRARGTAEVSPGTA